MSIRYDIVVFDKEDFPFLIAEAIKVLSFDESTSRFYYQQLSKHAKRIGADYILIVSPSKIELWNSSDEKLAEFDTATALGPYIGKEFTLEEVSHHYLEGLVMLWLDDLIYPWKETEAPYKEELERLDILKRLEKGKVETEVKI